MSTPGQTSAAKCYLLALPAELRTHIYELVLTLHENQDEAVHITRLDFCKSPNPKPTVLSLLATCRQIHLEAAGIFYNLNNLQIRLEHLYKSSQKHAKYDGEPIGFLENASARRLAGVHRLTVSAGHEVEHVTLVCKRIGVSMPRLKTLSVIINNPWFSVHNFVMSSRKEIDHHLLRRLLKIRSLERFVLILDPRNKRTGFARFPTTEDEKRAYRERAKEMSEWWTKKVGKPRAVCWEFAA